MNEVIKALRERRSIRSFSPDPVAEADLESILTAGLYAPSARNNQGTLITALAKPGLIGRLNEAVKSASAQAGFDRYAALVGQPAYSINFRQAPVFIIVSADPAATLTPAEDGALVLGQLMLAAHSLGLGSCWVNQLAPIDREPDFRRLLGELGLPESHRVIGCLALGHPAGEKPKAPERKPGRLNVIR